MSTTTSQAQRNIDVVMGGLAAFGEGDIETMLASYADDFAYANHGPEASGHRCDISGKPAFLEFLETMSEGIDHGGLNIVSVLGDDTRVMVLLEVAITAKSTGIEHNGPEVLSFAFTDGLVSRFDAFPSTPESIFG